MRHALSLIWAVLLLLGAGLSQNTAVPDVPSSKEDIQKLLIVLHVRERTELVVENSRKQFKTMAADMLRKELPDATDEERSRYQGMIAEMVDTIQKDYPIEAILQDMVPVYQKHLTKADPEALIEFYSSPVGQKVLRELPAITIEAMQVSNNHLHPRMEAAIDQLKRRIEEKVQDGDKTKKVPAKSAKPDTKS